jgi:hypothetical protein
VSAELVESRREFLKSVGVITLAVAGKLGHAPFVGAPNNAGAPVEFSDVVIGNVRRATPTELSIETRNGEVNVRLLPDGYLRVGLDDSMVSGEDFIVGDRVAAEGSLDAQGGFRATAVTSVFDEVEFVIEHIDAAGAHTSVGLMQVDNALPGRGLPDPATPGQRLRGLGWVHPATGARYLLLLDRSA